MTQVCWLVGIKSQALARPKNQQMKHLMIICNEYPLNTLSKYITNTQITIYIFFFVFRPVPQKVKGGIHKLRFWGFLTPLRWQVYYISLWSMVDIWLTPSPLLVNVVYGWALTIKKNDKNKLFNFKVRIQLLDRKSGSMKQNIWKNWDRM